jgi:hypothetical protein
MNTTPRITLITASLLILATFLLAFFFYSPTDNWRWDPSFYYAQLRSPVIDRDFNYRDETIPANGAGEYTSRGLQPSLWPVGPSLLWGPFFLAAHGVMLWLRPAFANGSSSLYVGLVSAGSALLGLIGLWVNYLLCRRFSQPGLALIATALALFATPLFYYIFRQPLMAHSTSFLFVALVILASVLLDQGEIPLRWSGLILGAFTGVYGILRWTGLLIAVIPLGIYGYKIWKAWKARDFPVLRKIFLQLVFFASVALLCITPQLITWYQLHGQWLINPQPGFFSPPLQWTRLANVFISTNRGLLFWSPYILIGIVGLVVLPYKRIRNLLLLYILLYLLPLGFRQDWFGGGGYGPRFFLEILPAASLGFVALFRNAFERWWVKLALGGLGLLLILLQFSSMVAVENLVQLDWLDYQAYNQGQPLGLTYHLQTPLKLIQQPGLLLGRRPYVGDDRQTFFFHLVAGSRDLKRFAIPLIGLFVLPLGVLGLLLAARMPLKKALFISAVLLIIHQVGWTLYYLSLPA